MTAPIAPIMPNPRVSAAPGLRVANKYGPDIIKLGALDVKPAGVDKITANFNNNSHSAIIGGIIADSIEGVEVLLTADINNRCMPPSVDPVKAAALIAKSGVTGVVGADVRVAQPAPHTHPSGSPELHIQVMVGSESHVGNLFAKTIGGAPVVLDVQGD